MDWFYRLMGAKTTTTFSFPPVALFAVRTTYVAVHERFNVVHLYHYAEDIREELHEFFQSYRGEGEEGEEGKEEGAGTTRSIYIKRTPPYTIGDIVVDVHCDIIYTVGTALGPHSAKGAITSKRVNVYTSTRAYVEG